MSLRFHWMLPKGGEVAMKTPQAAARARMLSTHSAAIGAVPDMDGWVQFARRAEEAGIESVLISFSRNEPDPIFVACALGRATQKLKFIVAYRAGLIQPVTFVQQFNTLSALLAGRIALNIVAGSSTAEQRGYGDFLEHDERYARAEEFLAICHSFWRRAGAVDFDGTYYRVERGNLHTPFLAPDRTAPEIYISGHSQQAERLACTQGSCWLRVIDTPEKLCRSVAHTRKQGTEVCLRLGLICRPTRQEAVRAAYALLPNHIGSQKQSVVAKNDSHMYAQSKGAGAEASWLTRCLWTGLVPHNGPVWSALVGTPQELAQAFLAYKRIGVTQFIISGWPELAEVEIFGRQMLPLIRDAERHQEQPVTAASPQPSLIETQR